MARERSELEQRRAELTRSLPGLSEERADTYRRNSDALALDCAGVKHKRPEEPTRASCHRRRDQTRLGARFGRTARRAHAAR
jgi:hypothetical protein